MNQKELESALPQFRTRRILIDKLRSNNFGEAVKNILTPEVTEYLPDGWQKLTTKEKINAWIKQRDEEGCFFNIRLDEKIVGFCFFHLSQTTTDKLDIRFGYLLSKGVWGKGIGTEFIQGLINWCEALNFVNSVSGGVERNNIGSIRVLEKTGFVKDSENIDTIFYRKDF